MKTSLVILTLFMAFAGPVFAHETAVGDLQIIHANIPKPGATARSAAGYMVIANDGTEADEADRHRNPCRAEGHAA